MATYEDYTRQALDTIRDWLDHVEEETVQTYAWEAEQACGAMTPVQTVNWLINRIATDLTDHLYLDDEE